MVNLDSFAFWLLADNFKRSANVRCTRLREYSSFFIYLFIIGFMFAGIIYSPLFCFSSPCSQACTSPEAHRVRRDFAAALYAKYLRPSQCAVSPAAASVRPKSPRP